MISRGLDRNNFLLSRFIHTCSYLGFLDHAYSTFSYQTQPDIYLYNTMIKALSRHPHQLDHHHHLYHCYPKEAIILYNKARVTGFFLDSYTVSSALKAVVCLSSSSSLADAIELGKEIHSQAIVSGLDVDAHVAAALMRMYSSCGCTSDARIIFDGMPQVERRNVISWTILISGYNRMNRPTEAINTFRIMQLEGVRPDEIAMLAALSACAHLGALELGECIHNYIHKNGLHQTLSLTNALIDMYAKSGNIPKALEVFENMNNRNVITWTTIIGGFALHGLGREALDMFSRMEMAQVSPNHVTLTAVLSACSHVGLVEMGSFYFDNMYSRYGINPKIEHYGCMIDLLGRAGCLQEAQQLLRRMPFEANATIWGSLLAASRIHGDIELGRRSMQYLVVVESQNSGNYSLLSNLYASLGRWNEAGIMRKVMRDTGVRKIPGGSCIEVNNMLHEFNAGDLSHPLSERIYKVLHLLYGQLKMIGHAHKEFRNLL